MHSFLHRHTLIIQLLALWGLLVVCGGCRQNEMGLQGVDAEKLFVHEVYPLLESKCFACHGNDPEEIEAAFDLRSREGMLGGGESGQAALLPGKPKRSPLYVAASWEDPDFQMPPKENDRLTARQLSMLEYWIAQGAPWPDSSRHAAILAADDWDFGGQIRVKTSEARTSGWANRRYKEEDLWAFTPLTAPEVPANDYSHPIDAFIYQKLKEKGLTPAAEADKLTLVRRASFDLRGLPPSIAEVKTFLADQSEQAYPKLIDRLLASPHYGEQWARHWLDVARYADSDGFANDYARPHAWRYRDYVIRSFNEDKPYNQFILEQLAGDEIDPSRPEMLIATGFLRMGPWEHTGMSVAAETRQFFLDDVTNSVGETFLSIPLRCARCHDHKFDPIPTKDYYRIQAVFATTQFAEREAPFLPQENLNGMEEEKAQIMAWIKRAEEEQKSIAAKEEAAARAWYRARGLPYLPRRQRMKLPEDQRPARYLGLTYEDLGYRKVLQKELQTLHRELGRYEAWAFSVYDGPARVVHSVRPIRMPEKLAGNPEPTFILTGGSVYAPAEEVTPGILSAIPAMKAFHQPREAVPGGPVISKGMQGRRLQFAHWLARADNPLVLRSIVNRVWQYHFGKGLAENSNNFGATGKKPTHPELLDWLVGYFVGQGWSIKALHRLIMTSATYRRASDHAQLAALRQADPRNDYLAVFSPRRLEAEEIRDAMLLVSGELNPEMGGIPVRPEINLEVALQPRHIMGSVARAYQPSPRPEQRNRRSIYTERLRGLPNPMLEVFNQPGPDLACERRTASTISPQAFTLLNSSSSYDRALAFALDLQRSHSHIRAQLMAGMMRVWNRPPSKEEMEICLAYLKEMQQYHRQHPPQKMEYPLEVRRKMFEEMTGEPFEYTEKLDIYSNYVPDKKAWEVSPASRALADLCLLWFNANEFIYLY
ncbi:MAG: DUF1549 domain-containing protein [Bacteroidetes bacterium]|nr:MAG: DUF1549 domain-containing protein [Bacteroidota bacterium]